MTCEICEGSIESLIYPGKLATYGDINLQAHELCFRILFKSCEIDPSGLMRDGTCRICQRKDGLKISNMHISCVLHHGDDLALRL